MCSCYRGTCLHGTGCNHAIGVPVCMGQGVIVL